MENIFEIYILTISARKARDSNFWWENSKEPES